MFSIACAVAFGVAAGRFVPGLAQRFTECPPRTASWPVVTASGAACGLLAWARGPVAMLPFLLVATLIGGVLAEVDVRALRLPDPLVGLLALVLGLPLTLGGESRVRALLAAAVVGAAYLVVALLPGDGLGLGDVKLAAVLAYALGFLGWPAVVLGAVAPHLINGPVAVVLLALRRVRRRSALPFGPALLGGAVLAAVAY